MHNKDRVKHRKVDLRTIRMPNSHSGTALNTKRVILIQPWVASSTTRSSEILRLNMMPVVAMECSVDKEKSQFLRRVAVA